MKISRLLISDFLLGTHWRGRLRWAIWLVSLGAVVALGVFRAATDAEFAVASLALFPVLAIAWGYGIRSGLFMAALAAATWVFGDIASGRQFSAAWVPWANGITRLLTYGMVAYLAGGIRLLAEREHADAGKDSLTGLQNRRAFIATGKAEVYRARRYARSPAVLFLDLDNFKELNDTLGHDTGDAALCATARTMLNVLRTSDQVARFGGDEFAILLPEIGYDAAVDVGHKISVAVNNTLEHFPTVRASVGVAWFEHATCSFEAMLKAADELMYEAKRSGKGNVRSRKFDASYIVN